MQGRASVRRRLAAARVVNPAARPRGTEATSLVEERTGLLDFAGDVQANLDNLLLFR